MIRVLLVDDHHVVLAGLSRLLEGVPDIEVVGEASGGLEAIGLVGQLRPDVVVMDLSMPGVDGIAATARITADRPDVRVLVLTSSVEHERVLAAFDAGACGYLLKESEPNVLVEGIRSAARSESPLDPRAARALLLERSSAPAPRLSRREVEVLELVAQGLLNKQIARTLHIGEKTVKAHLTSIFQRIGVSDRRQAAQWALRNGIGSAREV